MVKTICTIVLIIVAGYLVGGVINQNFELISKLETRVEQLEDRIGELCITVNGKSTGFDRAMIGG